MEHSRNLNNELYCHKLFWVLNLVFLPTLSVVAFIVDSFPNDIFDYIFIFIEFIGAILAVVMMAMTTPKKRTTIPMSEQSFTASPASLRAGVPIKVTLNLGLNSNDFISFKVETDHMCEEIKRKFSEFIDIQNYILEYIQHYLPEKINEVPIINQGDLEETSSIASAFVNRLSSVDDFLQAIASNKEFWEKEVLEFLGIEGEENQANLLAQHDRYMQMHKRSLISDRGSEASYAAEYQQKKPLISRNSKDSNESKQKERRGTYYAQSPQIIPDYNPLRNRDENEPDRKMLKITVTDYKRIHNELEYTILIDYYEGKNWRIVRTFPQIVKHRKRVSKKYPHLTLPVISEEGNSSHQHIMDKRKYEIQAYINYLLKSKVAYKTLLELIEFQRFSDSSLSKKPSIIEPETSEPTFTENHDDTI